MASEEIKTIERGAVEFLNDLCWHDSVLHEIRLIRQDSADEVILVLELLDDSPAYVSTPVEMTFYGCFAVECAMNWGVTCMSTGEMIMSGEAALSGTFLQRVTGVWKNTMTLPPLAEFSMELASTGSQMRLLFQRVGLRPTGGSGAHPAPPPIALG